MAGGVDPQQVPPAYRRAIRQLALNGLLVRVIEALEASQIPALAIKGPVNRHWLYGGSSERTYSDVDLLIAPSDRHRAREVLARQGMDDHHSAVLGVYRPLHEEAWIADEGVVDLHWSVAGIPPRSWEAAWTALSATTEQLTLGGRTIAAPDEVGRCLLLGLHAAQSVRTDTSRADLRVALSVLPHTAWERALAMAKSLHCDAEFVSGLSSEPAGRHVLTALCCVPRRSLVSHLYERGAPYRATLWAARMRAMLHPTRFTPPGLLDLTDADQPLVRRVRIRLFGGAQALRGLIEFASAALAWFLFRRSGRSIERSS